MAKIPHKLETSSNIRPRLEAPLASARRAHGRETGVLPRPAGAPILAPADAHLDPLIRKLESIAPVLDDEKRAIAALPITVRDLRGDQDILRDQDGHRSAARSL